MIVVLDANTLASMAVARVGGTLATILAYQRAGFISVVVSPQTYDEFLVPIEP